MRYFPSLMKKSQPLFKAMGLAVPEPKDFVHGSHLLLFVDAFGICIRMGEARKLPYHDRVLEPLKTVSLGGKMVFEILPIIRHYTLEGEEPENLFRSGRAAQFLRREFAREGLDFTDPFNRNIGLIPFHDRGVARQILVVLDRGNDCILPISKSGKKPLFTNFLIREDEDMESLQRLREIFHRNKNKPAPSPHFTQLKAYEDLRDVITRTWGEGETLPSPDFVKEFWPACLKAMEEGRLARIADQPAPNYELMDCFDVRVAASNYTETLLTHLRP